MATKIATRDIIITREFDAPRELVWKAWTDPDHLARWWGPKNYTAPTIKMDVRAGGTYLWCMRAEDGQNYWTTGTYREVVAPERLVYTDSFADPEGNVVSASYYGMDDNFPLEGEVTLTFEEIGGRTRMTLLQTGMPATEHSAMAEAGWNESFDKLAASLK